jgi:predicted 2-oxoglutarate/Fe(II)-dependent dioxygenase YbiX|tara:strand:- start:115 stop:702 length:588 start_codon:yes stop_codon:yes gene_type:complete
MEILNPFGPPIYKSNLGIKDIEKINSYLENNLLNDDDKKKKLDASSSLVGKVKEEIHLEKEFLEKELLNIIGPHINNFLVNSNYRSHKSINLDSCWVVRQYESEYNPVHSHNGDVSGVLYLKFPQDRKSGKDGSITFVNSPTFFLNRGHLTLTPEIGSIFLFPSYVLHTVYPIRENQEERRCIAFNSSLSPSPKI